MIRKTYCGNLLWQSGLVGSLTAASRNGLLPDCNFVSCVEKNIFVAKGGGAESSE